MYIPTSSAAETSWGFDILFSFSLRTMEAGMTLRCCLEFSEGNRVTFSAVWFISIPELPQILAQ